MRVVFSVAPAKNECTKKARSLIARAPNKWVFFLLFRFETAWDVWEFEKETKRTPIPCYTLSIQKILQSCIQYVFSVHLCIHQKNMKQEQNRYVDRFLTGWL